MATIELRQVEKKFANLYAVQPMDLKINDGEFVVLLGPSGCGKTTTLRMISGLETVTGGTIWLNERNVTWRHPSERDIAFVFQLYALYPHMNVRENIAFPLQAQHESKDTVATRVKEVVELLRIEHLLDEHPGKLGGGDQQRVALARALVRRPAAFLMDEPLGALDADLRETMRAEIRALQLRLGVTTVYVTHDQIEAMAMGDRIVVMSNAVVQQVGTPTDVYYNPANLFVARFIGSPGMNLVKGRFSEGAIQLPGGNRLAVPAAMHRPLDAAGEVVLGFRPESAHLNSHGALAGHVYATNLHGSYTMVSVNMNEGDVIHIRGDRSTSYPVGERVHFDVDADMVRYFDPKLEAAIRQEVTA